jgi:DNA-binding response OmpR family regulator
MVHELSHEQLLEEVELLRQQLGALTGSSHGMTHRLATILYILVKRAPAVVSRSTFHQIIYGDRPDGGPEPKIFDIHVSRLRSLFRRIEAPGTIETVWHAGYKASPELVQWVNGLFDKQIPKEK